MVRAYLIVAAVLLLLPACGLSAPDTQPTDEQKEDAKLREEYEKKWQAAGTNEEKMRLQQEFMKLAIEREMARTARSELSLAGTVVDETGKPLDGVKMVVEGRAPYRWGEEQKNPPPEESMIDREFNVSRKGLIGMSISFQKEGYYSTGIGLSAEREYPGSRAKELARAAQMGMLELAGDKGKVRMIMEKMGQTTTLQEVVQGIAVRENWQAEIINFAKIKAGTPLKRDRVFTEIKKSEDVPSNCLTLLVDRDTKTGTALTKDAPPRQGAAFNIPQGSRLYLNAKDGGLLRYEAKHPWRGVHEMRQAPEAGYKSELVIDDKMIEGFVREFSEFDSCVYFFFKTADGRFGKGCIRSIGLSKDGTAGGIDLRLFLQPDGTRNLEDPELRP